MKSINSKDIINENTIREILNDYHLLSQESKYLLFNPHDLSLYKTNSKFYEKLQKISDGKLNKNNNLSLGSNHYQHDDSNLVNKNTINRLVLNISNACNLNCKYCYASGGSYGQEEKLMDVTTAVRTLDYFCSVFDEIDRVQFFGGEPLLNYDLIGDICYYTSCLVEGGKLNKIPDFSIVTNGTLMDDSILDILHKYQIDVTLSLDGPEDINDYLRGSGTYNAVCGTIGALQSREISFGIETTLTSYHLKQGIDPFLLLKFYSEELGLSTVHMAPVSAKKDDDLFLKAADYIDSFKKCINYSLHSFSGDSHILDSVTLRLLRALINRKKIKFYCPAGIGTLAVSAEGEIYPCFMFDGNQEFKLGNIWTGINLRDFNEIRKSVKAAGRGNVKCKKCWLRNLCFGCMGSDYILNESLENTYYCQFTREIVPYFLFEFASLLDDNEVCKQINNLKHNFPSLK